MNLVRWLAGKSKSPVIALLTDFGRVDHYVATVNGVVLSINPSATIVDISHDVQPQNIRQAGYLLWAAYKFFPNDTIFVCVVDPGVGGKRRIVGLRTMRGVFLAPDNMLLDFILAEEKVLEAVEVPQSDNPYLLQVVSSTFHGRDIFAPVAAHLSLGVPLRKFGSPIAVHPTMSPFLDVRKERSKTAEILHVDRFGNIITNLQVGHIETASHSLGAVIVGAKRINRWARTYEEAPGRKPVLILGSSGLVEIVVKNDSAARFLKATIGDSLKVLWR